NDDADADRQRAYQNRQGGVVLLNHFFPKVVRRELVEQNEGNCEYSDAEEREKDRIDHIGSEIHFIFLRCSGDSCCTPIDKSPDCRAPIWGHLLIDLQRATSSRESRPSQALSRP